MTMIFEQRFFPFLPKLKLNVKSKYYDPCYMYQEKLFHHQEHSGRT